MNSENLDRTSANPAPDLLGVPRPPERRRWPWVVAFVVLAGLGLFIAARGAGRGRGAAAGRTPPPVSVVVAAAKSGDVGVYLNGLGSVTPLATVTVRSRVDGELVDVAFREGQLVRAGDLLAQIDRRPFEVQLQQAQGQLAKDEAALANAKLDLDRYQVLIRQDSVSKQQLDTQQAAVRQLEAALETDRAAVASAQLNLTYSRVTSPISGKVGLRVVDPGNIVHATDPGGIVVVTELAPISVVFTLAADRLPEVQRAVHGGAELAVEAWDRDLRAKLATGKLSAIDNQIDPATGTVRLRALFDNADDALFPNQFVNARLLVETLRGAVIVPAAAIQHSPDSTFVWLAGADDTVAVRKVEVAHVEGDEAAIASGLSPGDRVVVDGVDKLQPGAKIAIGGDAQGGARAAQ